MIRTHDTSEAQDLNSSSLLTQIKEAGIDFITGVPDSEFKLLIQELELTGQDSLYALATREDNAVALAAGAFVAGRQPLIFMESSGVGNIVDVLTSLVLILNMPLILFIAWAGYKGRDVPHHNIIGENLSELLDTLKIQAIEVCLKNNDAVADKICQAVRLANAREGWCRVTLPLEFYRTTGYALTYPENWIVSVAGPEPMNLFFETPEGQEVFIQLTLSDLPLAQADEATYSYEMSGPTPLVGADETLVARTIQTIGDKQVLSMQSSIAGFTIKRYFLVHNGTVYMFQFEMPTTEFSSNEALTLQSNVEEMVASLQFTR